MNVNQNIIVSVIMPIFNEEKYISKAINSILDQDIDLKKIEIIIADGMSNDNTRDIIHKTCSNKVKYIILDNISNSIPKGLNLAINNSQGGHILRFDGHSSLPPNYITKLLISHGHYSAACIGGRISTIGNRKPIGRSISVAQSSIFGVGGSKFRLNNSLNEGLIEVDTLAFGMYRRDIFSKYGLFDEDMSGSEDDEFHYRLTSNKEKILLDQSLLMDYHSRVDYFQLFKQYFFYGFYKILFFQKTKSIATFRSVVPLLVVIAFFTLLMVAFMYEWYQPLLFSVQLYFLAALFFSIYEIFKRDKLNIFLIPLVMFSYLTLHVSYGLGMLTGFFKYKVTL